MARIRTVIFESPTLKVIRRKGNGRNKPTAYIVQSAHEDGKSRGEVMISHQDVDVLLEVLKGMRLQ